MGEAIFATYRFIAILLFLLLSAVLLYHRAIRRWFRFSLAYMVVYALGGFLFFGKLVLPLSDSSIRGMPYLLFFFGTIACVGYCIVRQLSWRQTAGVLGCYFAVLVGFLMLAGVDIGLPREGAVESFLVYLPYVLFFAAAPIVVGLCLIKGCTIQQSAGILLLFGFGLLICLIAALSYFARPFGFAPQLSLYSRAWIEVGSVLLAFVGFLLVLGNSLLSSLTFKESLGAIVTFFALTASVLSLVHLTIGYEFLGSALVAR